MTIAQIGPFPLDVNCIKGGIESSVFGLAGALAESDYYAAVLAYLKESPRKDRITCTRICRRKRSRDYFSNPASLRCTVKRSPRALRLSRRWRRAFPSLLQRSVGFPMSSTTGRTGFSANTEISTHSVRLYSIFFPILASGRPSPPGPSPAPWTTPGKRSLNASCRSIHDN